MAADRKPHKRESIAPSSTAQIGTVPASGKGASSKPKKAKREQRAHKPKGQLSVRALAIALGLVCTLLLASAIGIVVLSHTDAFSITSIEAEPTEHVSTENIATLAGIPEGTTLLNYDEALIVENLKHNPWVEDVTVSRVFPDKLKLTVTERKVSSYVMMNSASVIWCMGEDNVWIEPVKITAASGKSVAETALAMAVEQGTLLVTDVPLTVNPVAGEIADDEVFKAIHTYRDEFSDEFWEQIVSINAPSVEGLSCILRSGVEISLGAALNVAAKETVITQLMAKYPNRLTYINVRVPSSPSYRMVDSDAVSVVEGTGAIGDVPLNTPTDTGAEAPNENGEGGSEGEASSEEWSEDWSEDWSGDYSEYDSYSEDDYYSEESYDTEFWDYSESSDSEDW